MPKRVGKYEIGRTLGEGTFGKVKFAVNTDTGERVAIKILDKEKIQKQNMGAQIKKEISIMKMVNHDHVVKLYEVLASRTKIFIVLELITGGELFDKIVAEGRFSEDMARFYFRQLVRGVAYCHSQGVCHRDLKPENLLLDEHSNLKISDFGLSALYTGAADDSSRATLLHTTCGTPNYVAPEVLSDKGYDGRAADMWSCGVILYVLLAGFLPFDEPNMSALFKKIQKAEFVYPSWFTPQARDLIDHILIPDPVRRYTIGDVQKHPWYLSTDGGGTPGLIGPAPGSSPVPAGAAGAGGGGGGGGGGAGGPTLHLSPSEKDISEAVGEGEEEGEDDEATAPPSLNAFDIVNMFGGLSLNRLLASDDDRRAVSTPQFLSAQPAATIVRATQEALAVLGAEMEVDERSFRVSGEIFTKNGAVTLSVLVFRMTDKLQLVEIKRGRGDILAYNDVYKRVRASIATLAA